MAEFEFHEEMVSGPGAPTSVGNTARSRGQIHESITIGTGNAPVRDEARGNVEQESITIGRRGGVALSERAQKMLANIDRHGTVDDDAPVSDDSPPPAEVPAAAVTPAQATPPDPQSAPAATAAPSSTAPEKSTEDAITERTARLETANRDLVAQLEQLKARPARGEPTAREKALDEAERLVLEDSIGAVRKVFATALGVDDPKHASVDKFMTWLYHDLTEHELNVPLDASIKALRESERNLALRARDKRDMAAEAAKPAPQPADQPATEKVGIVSRLLAAQTDHATKFPLLRNLSVDFDGMKPEELLWRELDRGFQTGEYDRNAQDVQLIDQASRRIEFHYQALADKIAKARPSTATPTQAAVATEQKADPQTQGVRTITNASASVAPATTPAAKPAPTETTKKPWRNEKERIRMLAAKHFGENG